MLGDGYQQGMYDGSNLARDAGIVVVTLNYRLGALGFLAHEGLSVDEGDHSHHGHGHGGNFGAGVEGTGVQYFYSRLVHYHCAYSP